MTSPLSLDLTLTPAPPAATGRLVVTLDAEGIRKERTADGSGAATIRFLYPTYPAFAPDWAVLAGLGTSIVTGMVFGVLPARRAARMDPIEALRYA